MMNFEVIIGIEIHAEIHANTKMYSPSKSGYGDDVNTNTNVIDWGYPGTLPTLNKEAFEKSVSVALALNFALAKEMHFDRKNYFYPDNPKGYQITQQYTPLGVNGEVVITGETGEKTIHITRIHMEEDAGKSTHFDTYSLVDLNRQGLPLVEIVSEPEITSAKEAVAYVQELRQTLMFLGVNDGKLEEGSIRCDANVSLRPYGQKSFGVKTEVKNINSLSNIEKAIDFEINRQQALLLNGGVVEQETRRYDETTKSTILMRTKETSADYRYFPESDLPYYTLTEQQLQDFAAKIPEMPRDKFKRYTEIYLLSQTDANILLQSPETAKFFDESVAVGCDPKATCNWMLSDVLAYNNKHNQSFATMRLNPENFKNLLNFIDNGTISTKIAKDVLVHLMENELSTKEAIDKMGVAQISDPQALREILTVVINNNPQSIVDYKEGKQKAFGYLIGQIMQETKGQANPKLINSMLKEMLEAL